MKTFAILCLVLCSVNLVCGGAESDLIVDNGIKLIRLDAIMQKVARGEKLDNREDVILANGSGYILGFLHTSQLASLIQGANVPHKVADTVTLGQIAAIAAKFLRDNPKYLNEDVCLILTDALAEAYPNPDYKGRKP